MLEESVIRQAELVAESVRLRRTPVAVLHVGHVVQVQRGEARPVRAYRRLKASVRMYDWIIARSGTCASPCSNLARNLQQRSHHGAGRTPLRIDPSSRRVASTY